MIPTCDEPSCHLNQVDYQGSTIGQVAVHLGVVQPAGHCFRTLGFCSWACLSQWAYRQAITAGEEPPPDHPAEQVAADRALDAIGSGTPKVRAGLGAHITSIRFPGDRSWRQVPRHQA